MEFVVQRREIELNIAKIMNFCECDNFGDWLMVTSMYVFVVGGFGSYSWFEMCRFASTLSLSHLVFI